MVVVSAGLSEQSPCPAGTSSGAVATTCTNCDVGFYGPSEAQSTCVLASEGHYVRQEGATDDAACQPGKLRASGERRCNSLVHARVVRLHLRPRKRERHRQQPLLLTGGKVARASWKAR